MEPSWPGPKHVFSPDSPRPADARSSCSQAFNELLGEWGSLLPSEGGASLGLLQLGPREVLGGAGEPRCPHVCAVRVQTHLPPLHVQTRGTLWGRMGSRAPSLGMRVPTRPHQLTYRTASARSGHSQEPRHAHGDPRGDPLGAGVASGDAARSSLQLGPFATRAFISVLCIGSRSRFQSTSGLFTELSKNILSPLQASLPEGPGACPSLCWPRVRCAGSSPQRLKGTTGCTPERDVWAGTQRAAERGSAGGLSPPSPRCC